MKGGLKWLFILFGLALPIHQGASSVLLGISFFVSLFVTPIPPLRNVLSQIWDTAFYMLVLLAGLTYTVNMEAGWRVIETNLGIAAIPFILVKLHPLNKETIYEIYYAFCVGLILSLLYCLSGAIQLFSSTRDWSVFYGDQLLSHLYNTHSVYMEYYLIMAITLGFYLLYYDEGNVAPSVVVVLLFFFYLMMLLTGNGTATMGLLFVLLYFVLKYIFEQRRSLHRSWSFALALLFLMGLLVASSAEILGFSHDDYWERFVLWESASEALPDWIFGVGTGDYMTVLNQYYNSHHLDYFAKENFNPHNQYMEMLFSNGVVGLVALLAMIIRPIFLSVRTGNILGFLLLFPFLGYGITEVFLGRYQGVAIYGLLHQTVLSGCLMWNASDHKQME
ncbi:MAG: O-antigen ligase family protein [Bacteroidetes bacterium]|nr:O-antigen ligase family protein [Bacteroidota bacterium]